LFDKKLPAQQTEREYLTLLRQALVYNHPGHAIGSLSPRSDAA